MRKSLDFRTSLWIMAAVSLVVVAITFVVTTEICKSRSAAFIDAEINYFKDQCARYDDAAAESETKSLVRIADKVREFRRDLFSGGASATEADLEEFIVHQRLTGVIVTDDETGEVMRYVGVSDVVFDDWSVVLSYVSGVKTALNRCCTERFSPDNGYCYDYAAVGRADKKGIILCWLRQEEASVEGTATSIRTTLTGYNDTSNVLVVVTDGTGVIASNAAEYIGQPTSECVFTAGTDKPYGTLSRVKNGASVYYGMRAKTKNYYVYVFYPSRDVYSLRSSSLIVVLLLTASVFLAFMIMIYRMEQNRAAAEKAREAEYAAALAESADRATRANNAKTDFLRRMSHDLRTPINGIRGLLEMSEHYQSEADDKKRRELREKAVKTTDYLLELINEILEMSKFDQGGVEVESKDFDMSELLDSVGSVAKSLADDHGVTLGFKASVEHSLVHGGAVELKRILLNLIGNAVKYNSKGGTVTVGCKETGFDGARATYEFEIADTGIGMSREFLDRMYEPFMQENPDDDRSKNGLGLGLSIVKIFADKMGGTIDVKSEPGKGTTFTVSLTFSVCGTDACAGCGAGSDEGGRLLEGKTILVAEDNELNMEIARFILENAGATVIGAEDGKSAVNAFLSSEVGAIDAILMDVMMPVADGMEATKTIRESGRADSLGVPVVAMTANAFPDDVKKVLDAGMNAHHPKPLDSQKLVRLLAELIEKRNPDNKK